MNWIGFSCLFCMLAVATSLAWNRRFETVEGRPLVRVDDGRGAGFSLEKKRCDQPVARKVALPFGGPVDILHVRFTSRAVGLIAGKEKWEDGRVILDWEDADGRVVAHDTLASMCGSDKKSRSAEMTVRSVEPGLVPVLRIEHLGLSGRMEIRSLQAVAVRERGWVVWAVVALLGAWIWWCHGFIRSLTDVPRWRVSCAAAILLMMGWFLAVPGPWPHERPLAGTYRTGDVPERVEGVVMAGGSDEVREVEPLGEMPVQGSWLLWVKKVLSFLRPVLHAMLFAGPAFLIAALCGVRCAWWSGVLASCVVEAGQAGFGFGLDWLDAVDLLVDWAGIAGAVWMYCKVGKVFSGFQGPGPGGAV